MKRFVWCRLGLCDLVVLVVLLFGVGLGFSDCFDFDFWVFVLNCQFWFGFWFGGFSDLLF